MSDKVVGVLGQCAGQLGRMLASSATQQNIKITFLDTSPQSPAKQIVSSSDHVHGSFTDSTKILELADKVDILTVEIEHVDVDALEKAQEYKPELKIHPAPQTIRTIQDKYLQKVYLRQHSLPVSEFIALDKPNEECIKKAVDSLGLPLMLKSRTLAYDGRGNFALHTLDDAPKALQFLNDRPLYAEKWVRFEKEIAVMVVRATDGSVLSYPAVETVHKDNICHLVFAPLRSSAANKAKNIAEDAVKALHGAGVFGVEMFLMSDGQVFINEIAPRPHNSGHYTIEACETSQYTNHLRAILSLPLGSTALKVPSCAMLNLLGHSSSMSEIDDIVRVANLTPGTNVHLYGKEECRKGRKMGHITVTGESDAQVRERLRPLLLSLPSSSSSPALSDADKFAPEPRKGFDHPFPLVGIIMGSDSDLPVMRTAAHILEKFNVPFELSIVSAHRTPDRLTSYARSAAGRGLKVIIAGAGGAAHLPGMVASMTALPVIGVPVKGSSLDGVDSLYSIVQMPRGIPVATVAINNSTNAALLAVRILSAGIPRLIDEMQDYLDGLEKEVQGKVERVREGGWASYEYVKS